MKLRLPAVLRRSLRARLVSYFLLLSVLTVVAVGAVVNVRATDDLREAVLERLNAAAELKLTALDGWLEEQRRVVVLVAGLFVESTTRDDADAIRAVLLDQGTAEEREAAHEALGRMLEYVGHQSSDAQEFLLLDASGNVRVSTFVAHEGEALAGESFFEHGTSATWTEGVSDSVLTGAPAITLSTPIFASGNERVGVLAAVLDLVRLDRILLQRTGLGETGQTFLVGADGRFVSGGGRGPDDAVLHSGGIDAALDGLEGQGMYVNHAGVPVIGAYRWLPDIDAALVAEMSQEEAFAPARELAAMIALVGLLSAALLAIGIGLISAAIARPILGLASTATRVAGGDLDATAPITSEDEVGTLARSFNAMTAQLRENLATLEHRVEERTAELSDAERRYRRLVEELPLTLYIDRPDENAQSIYVNPTVEAMFGYPMDRWMDPGFFEAILHPDDRQRVLDDHKEAFARGTDRWVWEFRLMAADGRSVDVRDEAVVVRDDAGVAQYVQGFMMDMTEAKAAEAEVRRQKQYFEALVEASPVAIVVMDRTEVVTAWNPAAQQLFGYTADEAIGRHIDDLIFAEDHRAEGAETTRDARDQGRAQRIGKRMRRGGEMVDVEIVVVPLRLDGEHVGYYAIYHDIGELEDARHAAEAANQAKSAFLAAMSHEIRTPMNAIIGMSGLLVDTKLGDEQREYAEIIRSSSEALLTIINDILDFSKIEAGRVELEEEPFALQPVIEGALEVLAPLAAAKGVELAYAPGTTLPAVIVGDAGRLRQILLNLLSNAVKFTDAGEVVLELAGTQLPAADAPGERWEIIVKVSDTGIGIPADRMDLLFQSFSQGDASVSRRYGGTGLGLAISRRLAELMDGSLTASSTGVASEGSTFTLCFRADSVEGAVVPAPAAEPAAVRGRRVLIVDDNATNCRILVAQTERWGIEARATQSPTEALEWVRAGERFDVALLDFNMPEMDGGTLAAELRSELGEAVMPIIVLSSVATTGRRAAPIVATLTKPVKPSALLDALGDALGVRTRAEGDAPTTASADLEGLAEAHPLRILLAEDNAMNRRLALILLDRMGYAADVVTNGLEAVAAVESQHYDVVLMDLQMPELDGLEATRRIHERFADGARPRIIAVTANAMAEDRDAAVAAGMDDYIAKPIRPAELADALRRSPVRAGA